MNIQEANTIIGTLTREYKGAIIYGKLDLKSLNYLNIIYKLKDFCEYINNFDNLKKLKEIELNLKSKNKNICNYKSIQNNYIDIYNIINENDINYNLIQENIYE